MKLFKLLTIVLTTLCIGLSANVVTAKDKEYSFTVKGHTSEKVSNRDDFAMLSASEYALKKGYSHFTVESINHIMKGRKGSSRIGARQPKKKPYINIIIHCYDEASAVEDAHNAAELKSELENKYSL